MTKGQKEDQRLNRGNDKSPVGVKFGGFSMQGMNHQMCDAWMILSTASRTKAVPAYPGVFPRELPDPLLPAERSDETQPNPTGSPSSGLPGLSPGASSGAPPGTSPGAASGLEAGAELGSESGEGAGESSLKGSIKGTSGPTAQPLRPELKAHKRMPYTQTADSAASNR